MISVFHLEKYEFLRDVFRLYFSSMDIFDWLGGGDNTAELVRMLRWQKIDVVIFDAQTCPGCLELCKFVRVLYPEMKIIIHYGFESTSWIKDFTKVGVTGFISKHSGLNEIERGINFVYQGLPYICPVSETNLNRPPLFSDREKQVLQFVAKGFSAFEIGEKLSLSHKTIEADRKNICVKINAKNLAEMMVFAAHNGFLFE